jgi:rod shape determining protein RodA
MLPRAWPQRMPWALLLISGALLLLGLCGIARSEELADGDGHYARHQLLWAMLASVAVWLAALPGYRILRDYAYPFFGATLFLLVAVYFFPPAHGAQRWIRLGGVGFQPSEVAKLVFVLALARYLMRAENYRHFRGLVGPLALTLVPVLLVLREPDLGTALVFLPVLFAMLYAAGARKTHLAALGLCGIGMLPVVWSQMSGEQRSRVTALFEQNGPEKTPSYDGYHLHQSKQMLALGGKRGSFWSGDYLLDRAVYQLPEDHTDFIFVVLIERLGWSGALAVLGFEFGLVLAALSIATRTREPFGRLAAMGIGTLFGVEAFINTAMTVGLLPVTGLSLPLVSYGGTGLLIHGVALGLVVNIALRPGFELGNMPFRFVERAAVR